MAGQSIGESLSEVRAQVNLACQKAGRHPDTVKIIAVTKKQEIKKLREAYALGLRCFAENYVQEALAKQAQLVDLSGVSWHFIGHLQRNKVRQVVGAFAYIHSIDSLRLAQAVSRIAQERGLRQKVLLEINVGQETSKSGFAPEDLSKILHPELAELPGLDLCGIMSFPPPSEDPELSRRYFRQTRVFLQSCQERLVNTRHADTFCELSMGTSGDYFWAVVEGATMVRLGTTLLGHRQ